MANFRISPYSFIWPVQTSIILQFWCRFTKRAMLHSRSYQGNQFCSYNVTMIATCMKRWEDFSKQDPEVLKALIPILFENYALIIIY